MKYVKYCFVTYFPHSTFLNIPSDLPLIFFICLVVLAYCFFQNDNCFILLLTKIQRSICNTWTLPLSSLFNSSKDKEL